MSRLLWVVQVFLGLLFISIAVVHFVVPDGLPEQASWMYDLSPTVHAVIGTAEILGGLGLILPGLTGIRPGLTVWAALGLIAVMVLASVWHAGRGEWMSIGLNLVTAVLLGFVVYGRTKISPFQT